MPELNTIRPLMPPVVPALAVPRYKDPLLVVLPEPDAMLTAPPVPLSDEPAAIVTAPPY